MAEVRKVNNMREKDNENEVQEEFALTSDAELQNGTEAAVGSGNTQVTPFAEQASGSEAEISSELRSADEPIFNVMPPVKTFTGRTAELIELHEKLQKPREPMLVSQCVAICGLGGVGKTELALKYAWEYFRFYKHIIWINCEKKFDTLKSFQKLAEDLKIVEKSPDDYKRMKMKKLEKDLHSILPKIYKRLAKSLLIFDNVDHFEDIENFLPLKLTPADEKPAIIITSRNSDWDIGEEGDVDVILLKQFTYDEAESYVRKSLQINDEDKSYDKLIYGLVRDLRWFPLALHQAVSCIKSKQFVSRDIQEHLKECCDEEQKENLLKWRPKRDRYTETTYSTWRVTFENIRKERNGDLAILLVEIMSYLRYDISREMFIGIVEDEERLKEAIDMLVKYSILTVLGGKARVNELVQLVVRLWLKDNQREEEVLTNILTQVYKYLHAYHFLSYNLFSLWSYACNYTTLIDDYFCKTYDEMNDHRAFIRAFDNLVEVGNVLLIRKVLDHLESKSYLWHKMCSKMFLKVSVKCNHKDPRTEDICHETHVKNICLFHTEVNKALKTSKTGELKEFLKSFDKSLINSWCKGDIAIEKSVKNGNLDVVKVLIENGADINLRHIYCEDPLTLALKKEHPKIAEYLLDQGANPNPHAYGWDRKPIHYAAKLGYINIMQRLADTKEDFESRSSDDWTPWHFAAKNDQLEIVEFLTSKGVDVTAMTEDGETACHIAVQNRSIRVVKYLIDNKLVDVNLRNRQRETLLHTAAAHGHFDIVKYLLSVENRIKEDINAFDIYGMTPLLQAVANGYIEIVRYLIQHGAGVDNVQNETMLLGHSKLSALQLAADFYSWIKQVAGVDNVKNGPTLFNQLKLSALHLAAARNYLEITKILVAELNADVNMGLDTSVSPLQVANTFDSTNVRDFLLEKGADESITDNSANIRCIIRSCFGDRDFSDYNENERFKVGILRHLSESFKPCCRIFGIIHFFYHLKSHIWHECK